MSRTVLISLDISNLSLYQKAVHNISSYLHEDDEVIFMTVIDTPYSGYLSSFLPKDIAEIAEEKAIEDLKAFSNTHFREFTNKKHIAGAGNVYEAVLEFSLKIDADLIITLERKSKHKDVPVFGPNAARIARHAQCSVLVIR